jgi:hypothetical protein
MPASSMSAAGSSPSAAGSGAPSTTPAPFDCTRAGLAGLVTAYFEAMAAHEPARVPFAPTAKLTENAKPVALGEGLWTSAGAPKFKRSALDTESCGTLTEAVVDRQGAATIVAVRLKLDAAQITEVETYIAEPAGMPQGLINSSMNDWEGQLPADQRRTREQLSEIADAYFDNLGDPLKQAPYGMPCEQSSNGLSSSQLAAGTGIDVPPTCGTVLLPVIPGLPNINASPTHRRYPVIDTEAGIAAALGLVAQGYLNASMLKVIGGKIRYIDSVNGPSVSSPGWD